MQLNEQEIWRITTPLELGELHKQLVVNIVYVNEMHVPIINRWVSL